MKPKIALVTTDRETNAQIKSQGVDLLELRVDLFKSQKLDYVLSQIRNRRALKIPLLLTVRNQKKEGALKDWSDPQKRQIIQESLPLVDMLDIELSSPLLREALSMATALRKKTIVSIHDFKQTPVHLDNIFKKALSTRPSIIKIAAFAQSFEDVIRMISFTHQHRKHPLITMSLGPLGRISRLVLPAAGSLYAYSFLQKAKAPGQIELKKLKDHLKFYYP